MRSCFQVTIDGPVGAGKSTVAQEVAEKLGFVYVDTGAMYRVVALAAKQKKIDWSDEKKVGRLVKTIDMDLKWPTGKKKDGRKVTVFLNRKDVSWEIREEEYGEGASIVGQYLKVRKELVKLQRRMSKHNNVVMEGRDIGTRVLPDADLKIYMDADLGERVRRKREQLVLQGQKLPTQVVRRNVVTRDNREMTRKVDPLRPAKDAWIFDTTNLSIDEVVDRICKRAA